MTATTGPGKLSSLIQSRHSGMEPSSPSSLFYGNEALRVELSVHKTSKIKDLVREIATDN